MRIFITSVKLKHLTLFLFAGAVMLICSCSFQQAPTISQTNSIEVSNSPTSTETAVSSTTGSHAIQTQNLDTSKPEYTVPQPSIDIKGIFTDPSTVIRGCVVSDGENYYYIKEYNKIYLYNKKENTDVIFYESPDYYSYISQLFILNSDLYMCICNDFDEKYRLVKFNTITKDVMLVADDVNEVIYASTSNIVFCNNSGIYFTYDIASNRTEVIYNTGYKKQMPMLFLEEKRQLLYRACTEDEYSHYFYLNLYDFNSQRCEIVVDSNYEFEITADNEHIIIFRIADDRIIIKDIDSLQDAGYIMDCYLMNGDYFVAYTYVKNNDLYLLVNGSDNKSVIYVYDIKKNRFKRRVNLGVTGDFGIESGLIYNDIWFLCYKNYNQKPTLFLFDGLKGTTVQIKEKEVEGAVGFDICDGFIWFYGTQDDSLMCSYDCYGKVNLSKYIN